jgi:hypothetical protein
MKKSILSVSMFLMTSSLFSQWVNLTAGEGSAKYNIAYCDSKETPTVYCKLEKSDDEILFYLSGGYFCEDYIDVTVDFLVNLKWEQFKFQAIRSESAKTLFIIDNITLSSCFESFKKSSSMIIGINDLTCGYDFYTFSMTNSTKSYDFVLKQIK